MTEEERNRRYPISCFRISAETKKLLIQKRDSRGVTWEELFLEFLNDKHK